MKVILRRFKTDLKAVEDEGGYYDRNTGDYIEGTTTIESFVGAVLPVSQDDLLERPDGGITRNDRKLYTSYNLKNGQIVKWNNFDWKIDSKIDYSYINPDFKSYFMIKRGDISD